MDNFSRLVPHPPAPPQPVTEHGTECIEKIKALLAHWTRPKAAEDRIPGEDDE